MADESTLPVWLCVSKESDDLQLLRAMLLHHGIEARVAPVPTNIGRHAPDAAWVRESDYDQAMLLIAQMENVPIGSNWLCRGCTEVNEPQFDLCWKCGKEKMAETA